MDNSNFGFVSIRPQKLKKNPTYQPTSGCAEPKSTPHLPRGPVNPILAEFEIFLQHFSQKTLSEVERNGSAIFHSRPRVKIELTSENRKKTSDTGSKGYV